MSRAMDIRMATLVLVSLILALSQLSVAYCGGRRTWYISPERGYDQHDCGRDFSTPCESLFFPLFEDCVMNDFILLTGRYNFSQLLPRHTIKMPTVWNFTGMPDCFPINNGTAPCNNSLPIISSFISPNTSQYLDVFISNVVMVPSLQYSLSMQSCSLLITADYEFASYLSITLRDSTVDLREQNVSDHSGACVAIMNPIARFNATTAMDNVNILISSSRAASEGLLVYVNTVHQIRADTEETRLSGVRVVRDGAAAAEADTPLSVLLSYDEASRVVLKNILLKNYQTIHRINSGANKIRALELDGVTLRDLNVTLRGEQVLISNSTFIRSFANISNDDFTTTNEVYMVLSRYVSISGCTLDKSTLFILSNVTEAHHNKFLSSYDLSDGVHLPPIAPRYLDSDKEMLRLHLPTPGRIDARKNYWGAPTGPSSCCNPDGSGLPVLWMTDFLEWCTVRLVIHLFFPGFFHFDPVMPLQDLSCTSFAPVSSQLNSTIWSQSRENIPACITDSLCTPVVTTAVWTTVGLQGAALLVVVIIYIYFAFQIYRDPFQRYQRMATAACVLITLLCIAWAFFSIWLPNQCSSVDNLLWNLASRPSKVSLAALLVSCGILVVISITTIILMNRPKLAPRFSGLRLLFVTSIVGSISIVYVGLLSQILPPMILIFERRTASATFPDTFVLPIFRDGLIPAPQSWTMWAQAIIGTVISLSLLGVALWNIIRLRDYQEVEVAIHEIEIRSSLLGVRSTSFFSMQGQVSRSARLVSILQLLPLALSIATLILSWNERFESPEAQKTLEWIVVALGFAVCVIGGITFALLHYRVVLCWIHVVISFIQALGVCTLIIYFALSDYTVVVGDNTTRAYYVPKKLYGVAGASGIAYLISGICGLIFIQRKGGSIAADINTKIKNRMETLLQAD